MMMKLRALASGIATWIPGYSAMRATGGTDSARYCYSVWLRHLALANGAMPSLGVPRTVAELGPGDSVGIGLAALLSGAEKYFAFDVVAYQDLTRNLAVFDELVQMFGRRDPIPNDGDLTGVRPRITQTGFPSALLGEDRLRASLDPARVRGLRESLQKTGATGAPIVYRAPWTGDATIEAGSVDFIFSQAVLEHVVDLDSVYAAMRRWIAPGGAMSHQIDYRCHGKAKQWNGHWAYGDLAWRTIVGRRPYLLNRQPHSVQMRHLREARFDVLHEVPETDSHGISRANLSPRFRGMSDADLVTCGAYVLAAPRA